MLLVMANKEVRVLIHKWYYNQHNLFLNIKRIKILKICNAPIQVIT